MRRGGRVVLDGVSFEARRGEIFGLLGPNGSGKTTAFQVLTGVLPADAGHLVLDGRHLPLGARELRVQMGVVFQAPALDPRLTARENLLLSASLYGVPRAVARKAASDLLHRVELHDRADEPVARFSGGMRRRIEIARALLHDPAILVLDEPTTGLDPGAFLRIWEHLLALRAERGLTLVLTTHHPQEAEYCDRLAILDRGRIVACDTPDRLRASLRGDVLVLETDDVESVADTMRTRLGLTPRTFPGRVVLEQERGHELIPRLVEALPPGSLRSISLRKAGLAEVFLELTGRELGERDP